MPEDTKNQRAAEKADHSLNRRNVLLGTSALVAAATLAFVRAELLRPLRCGERWTRLPMISTWDDICRIWSKRASSKSIVASLHRLAAVPIHLVQQLDRNVA